jgi:DNA polymerase elongation subunit (family B)
MLESVNPENVLFIDIETVPLQHRFEMLPERMKKLWEKKAERLKSDENDTPQTLYSRAGIYSEFGKIICISAGMFRQGQFRIKSFASHDEKELLNDFATLLNQHFYKPEHLLCAHNGREFDYPYIARRMMINGIHIPSILDNSGKKPWEIGLLDTMDLWKFGDYKNYTSLELLAAIFDIPTPKDDIDGSMVAGVYWEENNQPRIVEYCTKDVLTIAQLFRRFRYESLLSPEQVIIV